MRAIVMTLAMCSACCAPAFAQCSTFVDNRVALTVREGEPLNVRAYAVKDGVYVPGAAYTWTTGLPHDPTHGDTLQLFAPQYKGRYTVSVSARIDNGDSCAPTQLSVVVPEDYVQYVSIASGSGTGARAGLEFSQLSFPLLLYGEQRTTTTSDVSNAFLGLKMVDPRIYLTYGKLTQRRGLYAAQVWRLGIYKAPDLDQAWSTTFGVWNLGRGLRLERVGLAGKFARSSLFAEAGVERYAGASTYTTTYVTLGSRL